MFSKKKKNDNETPLAGNQAEEQVNVEQSNEEATIDQTENTTEEASLPGPPPEISPVEKLEEEITVLNDKYLRLFAEFDNYKRRTQRERAELLQTAGKDVITSLLTVLDDFDRANKAMENTADVVAVQEGIQLIYNKLKNLLSQKGLKEMESINTPFDTDLHEAITKIPAPNEEAKGKVLDVLEKGYTLNDKVIRFAKVVVGS
ncbi:nucleotide exchange factor GrpE [Pedobacter immunditicola]|uniref:nucleotide exchange factor GrpE n=1 Tax=Pedobacter immunditicola TaxID=3133440 RepID=UPI0030ACD06A